MQRWCAGKEGGDDHGPVKPSDEPVFERGLTAVIIVGAFRVNSGLTQAGKIIAFLSYFTIILNAMMSITRMFVMYSRGPLCGPYRGGIGYPPST